ncbi:zinc finger MYM-type protein 1-like [Tachysurus ichikawai]
MQIKERFIQVCQVNSTTGQNLEKVVATPVFQETAVASAALQRKYVDLAVIHIGGRSAKKASRTEDRKYKYSSKSTGEDHHPENLEEFYQTRVYYTFLDTISQEMLRRFKGKDECSTGIILKCLHSLTVASKWSKLVEPCDAELVRTVSKFYGIEEEKVFTELKVVHASYSFTKSNVQEMLKCLKDNEIESVFPSLSELLKRYATLPVSTSTVKRLFSKLKLLKSSLQSLCNEERFSDLLLLSIERDIPINRDEVIQIFKKTADRRILI